MPEENCEDAWLDYLHDNPGLEGHGDKICEDIENGFKAGWKLSRGEDPYKE